MLLAIPVKTNFYDFMKCNGISQCNSTVKRKVRNFLTLGSDNNCAKPVLRRINIFFFYIICLFNVCVVDVHFSWRFSNTVNFFGCVLYISHDLCSPPLLLFCPCFDGTLTYFLSFWAHIPHCETVLLPQRVRQDLSLFPPSSVQSVHVLASLKPAVWKLSPQHATFPHFAYYYPAPLDWSPVVLAPQAPKPLFWLSLGPHSFPPFSFVKPNLP